MRFSKAREFEQEGVLHRSIEEMIRLSIESPPLWPVALLELDRLLRRHVGADAQLSFSRNGFSPSSVRWLDAQSWKLPADLFSMPDQERSGTRIAEMFRIEKQSSVAAA